MRARALYEIRLQRRLRKRLAKKQGGGRKRKNILKENASHSSPIVIEQAHQTLRRKHLFKYKSLNGANFDHVKEIIRDSKIYCPKPSQLNDPKECRPDIVVGNLSNPAYRQAIHQWARSAIALRNPQL